MRNIGYFLGVLAILALTVGMVACDKKEDITNNNDMNSTMALEINKTRAALEKINTKIDAMVKSRAENMKIQKQLDEVREKTKNLSAQVHDLTEENARLKGLLERFKDNYVELEKKLKAFQAAGTDLKSCIP